MRAREPTNSPDSETDGSQSAKASAFEASPNRGTSPCSPRMAAAQTVPTPGAVSTGEPPTMRPSSASSSAICPRAKAIWASGCLSWEASGALAAPTDELASPLGPAALASAGLPPAPLASLRIESSLACGGSRRSASC